MEFTNPQVEELRVEGIQWTDNLKKIQSMAGGYTIFTSQGTLLPQAA